VQFGLIPGEAACEFDYRFYEHLTVPVSSSIMAIESSSIVYSQRPNSNVIVTFARRERRRLPEAAMILE